MATTRAAQAHLAKAGEFLQAAALSYDRDLFDATASASVVAGINCKDVICLALTGRSDKSDDHSHAVEELRRAGVVGAEAAPILARLLRLKSASQYRPHAVSARDASKAVAWATRLHALALRVAAG